MANNESNLQQGQAIHSDDEFVKLRQLVMQHKVCWEIWPEYHIDRDGKRVQIGFESELIGTHYHPEQTPLPGCPECVKVYNDLKRIAQWIIPEEKRDSCYETGIFDASIRYSTRRKFRKDINLEIQNMSVDALAAIRKAIGVENFKKAEMMPMMSGGMMKGETPVEKEELKH